MLVITRRSHESVVVGKSSVFLGVLKVTVVEIAGGEVKLAFEIDDGPGKDALAELPGTCRITQARCGCMVVDESRTLAAMTVES